MSAHKEKARLLIERSRYEMAQKELMEALREDPDNPEAHLLMGECHHHQGRHEESAEEIQKAIAADPVYSQAHYFLGWTCLDRSLKERSHQTELLAWAQAAGEKALGLNPQIPGYWALLACIRFNQGKVKKAMELAEKGLALDPRHQDCLNIRSRALSALGKHGEAEVVAENLLEIDPEEPNAFITQGWAYWDRWKFKRSLESFQEALRQDPNDILARNGWEKTRWAAKPFLGLIYGFNLFFQKWFLRLVGIEAVLLAVTFASPNFLAPVSIPFGALLLVIFLLSVWTRLLAFGLETGALFRDLVGDGSRSGRKRLLLLSAGIALGLGCIASLIWNSQVLFLSIIVPLFILVALAQVFRKPKGLPTAKYDTWARSMVIVGVVLTGLSWLLSLGPMAGWSDLVATVGIVTLLLGILLAIFGKKMAKRMP